MELVTIRLRKYVPGIRFGKELRWKVRWKEKVVTKANL